MESKFKYKNYLDGKMMINNYLKNSIIKDSNTKLEDIISFEPGKILDNFEKLNSLKYSDFIGNKLEKNIFLEEVIINKFENKFLMYFNSIKNLEKSSKEKLFPKYFNNEKDEYLLIFDLSLQLFQKAIIFLDKISIENNDNEIDLEKIYSLSFVKLYLYKFVGFTKNDISKIDDYKDIFQVINDIQNNKFKYIIDIYILKLYYYYLDNDFELLIYVFNTKLCNFFDDEIYIKLNDKNTIITNYYLFPIEKDKYQIYLQNLKEFEIIKRDKFSDEEKIKFFILNLLNNQRLDILLIISINKIFFNLYLNYDEVKFNENKIFLMNVENIIDIKYNTNKELIKLLNLFYNKDNFMKKIFPYIKNNKTLEIILYGFRYCIQSLYFEPIVTTNEKISENNKKDELLYKSLLTENYFEPINNTYIPGIDTKEYLHLVTLETIVEHLNTKPDRHGCYVCSCGYYYDIDPCGFPTKNRTFDCPVCGLKIGWGPKPVKAGEETHGMVIRPGHLRIFKDEKAKKYQMKVFDEVDENIPNMILDDYIKKIIEPIRKKNELGIGQWSKNFFEKNNKKIRNLSQIGYRLLNYIFYCHLFFSYCIENISEINLKQYLAQNMTIIDMIETNWKLLKESLEIKGVYCAQIFMNIIFYDVSELIKNCKFFYKPEEREKFEDEVEKIINKYIDKFDDNYDKYIEENKLQIKFEDYNNIETMICELIPVNDEMYNKKDYPLFNYFMLTKYKSKIDCLNHIPDKNKYSLTYQILSDKKELYLLQYLPLFNNFVNYMNKKYSFKITREEAHQRKIKDEIIFINDEFVEIFNNFINAWNIIKPFARKYKCNTELPIKELNSEDNLAYFLNDISEYGYGMYLAAVSQSFIEWQNSFLQNVLDNNSKPDDILYKYINQFKNKICVNEANKKQILLIEERIKNSEYKDINEIIYKYSERNIYKNDKINYSEYNNFKYDYEKIEEELGKIILSGLQMFKSEDNLNLVIYLGEGFKGKKSQSLIEFYTLYPQTEITFDEKNIIIGYLNEQLMKNNNVVKQLFSFFQILIINISTSKTLNIDTSISSLKETLSVKYEFANEIFEIFSFNEKIFTIDKILPIYLILEHLCYNDLILLLKEEYKKEINENKIKGIKDKINICRFYSKKDFACALRRFISRYLVGKGELNDIKTENDLCFELSREDLWNENIRKIDDLDDKIKENIGEFELKVNEAYCLYELIGGEDKQDIENIFE